MGVLKKLFVVSGALAFTGAGGSIAYRQTLVEQRKQEIEKEIAEYQRQERFLADAVTAEGASHASKMSKIREKREIVENLWESRFERYEQSGSLLQSYVTVLPEAVGLEKALLKHYEHMTKVMAPFPRFDFSVSHIQNFDLLLGSGVRQGLHTTVDLMLRLLSSEPLIKAVCENVARGHVALLGPGHLSGDTPPDELFKKRSDLAPQGIHELSTTFAYSALELEYAVAAAATLRDKLAERGPAVAEEDHRRYGIAFAGIRAALNSLKVNPEKETPIVAFVKQRANVGTVKDPSLLREKDRHELDGVVIDDEAADAFEVDAVVLRTDEDIRSAMEHVDNLASSFSKPENSWMLEKASTRNNISEKQLMEACQRVVAAVDQLRLWRKAAVCFLIEQQHLDALRAYSLCLGHTMCYVDQSIQPRSGRAA